MKLGIGQQSGVYQPLQVTLRAAINDEADYPANFTNVDLNTLTHSNVSNSFLKGNPAPVGHSISDESNRQSLFSRILDSRSPFFVLNSRITSKYIPIHMNDNKCRTGCSTGCERRILDYITEGFTYSRGE